MATAGLHDWSLRAAPFCTANPQSTEDRGAENHLAKVTSRVRISSPDALTIAPTLQNFIVGRLAQLDGAKMTRGVRPRRVADARSRFAPGTLGGWMRTMLGVLVLGLLAAPARAQPGQAPIMRPEQAPYEQPPPNAQAMQREPLPPGATRATFVSTGETRWDVRIDSNAVCTTPCAVVVGPLRYVTLHSQNRASTRLAVGYLAAGDVLVQAQPRAEGAFAAGVTFTTLTGMGLATGITLTAVGCSTDRSTMCNAGLITGVASAVGLYLSIDLLRRALPRVHIGQVQASPYAAANTVGLAGQF
jgi:hypothetical protein